jgi:hypothetical protein
LYNKYFLIPQGKSLEIISIHGLFLAFAVPMFISVFSVLPGMGENMKKGTLLVGS